MNTTTTQKNNGVGASNVPEPIRGNAGASVIGPRNPSREAENRDVIVSPSTDHGTLGNLRWSFADSHMHLSPGGWGRQTTIRELPTAPEIAGVNNSPPSFQMYYALSALPNDLTFMLN